LNMWWYLKIMHLHSSGTININFERRRYMKRHSAETIEKIMRWAYRSHLHSLELLWMKEGSSNIRAAWGQKRYSRTWFLIKKLIETIVGNSRGVWLVPSQAI
jgi:hypothetical protein